MLYAHNTYILYYCKSRLRVAGLPLLPFPQRFPATRYNVCYIIIICVHADVVSMNTIKKTNERFLSFYANITIHAQHNNIRTTVKNISNTTILYYIVIVVATTGLTE